MMDESFNVNIKHIKSYNLHSVDSEIKYLRNSVHLFLRDVILPNTHNKRVLEVGPAIKQRAANPEYFIDTKKILLEQGNTYTSLDIDPTSKADVIGDVANLLSYVDKWSFDIIIALEVLEHVRHLWKIPGNFFDALDHKGMFYVSSPFYFVHHDPKPDYWRISQDGYKALFGDLFKLDVNKIVLEVDGGRPVDIQVIGRKK